MSAWKKATRKAVEELDDRKMYIVIYDGGKAGSFLGEHLKTAHKTEAVILDWISEMPI